MPDQFTETKTIGYGKRIVGSLGGAIMGLILFIASFGILYWNEGRADLSTIARTAIEINSQTQNTDQSLNNKLISTTGVVNSNGSISDNLFLKAGKFLVIERRVEMYSWIEEEQTKSKRNVGGSETQETTYTYEKDWTDDPVDPTDFRYPFKYPIGHENPQKSIENNVFKVQNVTVGIYNFDFPSIVYPKLTDLPLDSQNTVLPQGAQLINNKYVFIPKTVNGTFNSPQIGDMRISYKILKPGFNGTIFGQLSGNDIVNYVDQDGNNIYRLFAGSRNEALSAMHSEYKFSVWGLRFLGLLCMWIGLFLLLGPISTILDVLPILGTISRVLIGVAIFVVSLVLSIVTILVSMLFHNIISLIIAIIVTIGIIIVLIKNFRNKKIVSSVNSLK